MKIRIGETYYTTYYEGMNLFCPQESIYFPQKITTKDVYCKNFFSRNDFICEGRFRCQGSFSSLANFTTGEQFYCEGKLDANCFYANNAITLKEVSTFNSLFAEDSVSALADIICRKSSIIKGYVELCGKSLFLDDIHVGGDLLINGPLTSKRQFSCEGDVNVFSCMAVEHFDCNGWFLIPKISSHAIYIKKNNYIKIDKQEMRREALPDFFTNETDLSSLIEDYVNVWIRWLNLVSK